VTVKGFKKCCISDEMDGREDVEEAGKLAVNMREDGNCEDNELLEMIGMANWVGLVNLNKRY
jgi:hypothetical protein